MFFFTPQLVFTQLTDVSQPFAKDTVAFNGYGHTWALKDLPSIKNEPDMRAITDGEQHISLIIKGIKGYFDQVQNVADSWETIGRQIVNDKFFIKGYDQNISDDDGVVKQAKALKVTDDKIALIYNEVKTRMGWNQFQGYWSQEGIKSAWKKRTGNWGEINMILYHLLKQAGVAAYPMLVSTRDNGTMYSNFPNFYQVNKLVVYVPVDTANYYVLDATDKFYHYNEIPYNLLNSNGLYLDKEKNKYGLVLIKKESPVKRTISIEAEIKPDATMSGNAAIYDYSYNKSGNAELYKTLDEKKYEEYLINNDNNIKITSLKLENADVDSLPLIQNVAFTMDLAANDEKYIYFSPNLFSFIRDNPFISKTRSTDIDFGYKSVTSIRGRFKIPAGYHVDFLPANINLVNSDKSLTMRRVMEQSDGYITVYYAVSYKNAVYAKGDYPGLYEFFKKMYESMNEQVVLKKS